MTAPLGEAAAGDRESRRRSVWLLAQARRDRACSESAVQQTQGDCRNRPERAAGSARTAWLLLPRSSSYALTAGIGVKQQLCGPRQQSAAARPTEPSHARRGYLCRSAILHPSGRALVSARNGPENAARRKSALSPTPFGPLAVTPLGSQDEAKSSRLRSASETAPLPIGHPGCCLDRRRERALLCQPPVRRAISGPAPLGGGEVPTSGNRT